MSQHPSDSNCRFAQVLADTAVTDGPSTSNTLIRCLWTQQLNGDTWQVPYAAQEVKVSNADVNVTSYNNGSKLLRGVGDTLHNVFRTLDGGLYYAWKYDDPNTGWSSSLLASNGAVPALSQDYLGRLWVAHRNSNAREVHCKFRNPGTSEWTDRTIYDCGAYTSTRVKAGPPSIAATLNDPDDEDSTAAYVLFTTFKDIANISQLILVKLNGNGVIYTDTISSVSSGRDSLPALALRDNDGNGSYLHFVWQRDGEIRYQTSTAPDSPATSHIPTLSDTCNLSSSAAASRHPTIAVGPDTVLVAWAEDTPARILAIAQVPGAAYNS